GSTTAGHINRDRNGARGDGFGCGEGDADGAGWTARVVREVRCDTIRKIRSGDGYRNRGTGGESSGDRGRGTRIAPNKGDRTRRWRGEAEIEAGLLDGGNHAHGARAVARIAANEGDGAGRGREEDRRDARVRGAVDHADVA